MSVPLAEMKGYMPGSMPDCGVRYMPDCGVRYMPDCGVRYMPDCGVRYMPDCGAGTVSSRRSTMPSEVIFSASA